MSSAIEARQLSMLPWQGMVRMICYEYCPGTTDVLNSGESTGVWWNDTRSDEHYIDTSRKKDNRRTLVLLTVTYSTTLPAW